MTRVLRALAAVAICFGAAACSSSGGTVPYKDPRSVGGIVLYDEDGKEQTSGKLSDKPFVAKAVGQAKAPAPYDKEGRKATLLAFQPRKDIDPATWHGTFLTGASAYPDPSHPTVVAPAEGLSLQQYLAQYPAEWDGLIQLRIFLGAPGETTLNDSYATADLRVKGDTWTLVRRAPSLALVAATEGVPITVNVEGSSQPESPSPSATPNGGALPRTGSDIIALATTGVFLLVTGILGVVLGRRRTGGTT